MDPRALELIKDAFTTSQASGVLNKSKNHGRESLITLARMGFLKSWKKKILEKRRGTPIRRIFKSIRKEFKTAKILLAPLSSLLSFFLIFSKALIS